MTLRRLLALGVMGLVLYLVAPAVIEVLEAWPRVGRIEPAWFVVMVAAQAASLWCLAKLQALCMGVSHTRVVLMSSLASGALGRVLPGGSATAAATQYGMLVRAGVPGEAIGVGLAAGTVLQIAVLCALPALALLAIPLGVSVPTTLEKMAAAAAAIFVVMLVLTVVVMRSDRVLAAIGRGVTTILRRLPRSGEPPTDVPERLIAQRNDIARLLGRNWRQALAVTVGRWVFDFLTLQAALAAIGADASLALTVVAYAGAQALAQVPLSPGGLGVVEAGLAASLVVAGTSGGEAAVATLAYRLVSYWLVLLAGLVAWLVHRRQAAVAT